MTERTIEDAYNYYLSVAGQRIPAAILTLAEVINAQDVPPPEVLNHLLKTPPPPKEESREVEAIKAVQKLLGLAIHVQQN